MVCKEWKLRIMRSSTKEMSVEDFQDYIIKEFTKPKVRRSIRETLKLLISNPFAYAREKLGSDIFGNQMFSIEVTKDIRILYSVD
ncbi:cytotoxic translational repressor of toxin-antitoxin stability system [Saccharolobus caldissimus]|uniref:Cytotoxic translational repressor of toxin-antitoxin stability system n=1 Tax=Saccharolobus caldissimus TaxID=1702097 RepID=A0AAQ4CR56_9CREN|nr:cytotoxic translational repressor of toxin-antitoxin stability system [Saccharolobus caldissimus]